MNTLCLNGSIVDRPVKPFLKWPGGKRWIFPYLDKILAGRKFHRYYEPFLGGGAVFFHLLPTISFLSDINEDLINTYKQVRDIPLQLIQMLQSLSVDKQTYLQIRGSDPTCKIERAVRFMYLNRAAFSGMYRVNRNGQFNVPYGGGLRNTNTLWADNLLVNAGKALQHATITCGDFENQLRTAKQWDLVYCDPTYTTTHSNNGFIRYNESNFSWSDQQRLAELCLELSKKGVTVIISNACHEEIACLYPTASKHEISRRSLLCPLVPNRRLVKEYLLVLDP
jgi:DNA adenine methylase